MNETQGDGTTPAPLGWRKWAAGLSCLAVAAILFALLVAMTMERFSGEPIKITGTIDRSGTYTDLGQPRRAAINSASLVITLKRDLVDGRYQPIFVHQPSVWPTDEAKQLAEQLPAGTIIELTVIRERLESAKEHLLSRDRLERAFRIYEPPLLRDPAYVEVIALKVNGKLLFDTTHEYLEFGLVFAFVSLATFLFAAVGTAFIRSR